MANCDNTYVMLWYCIVVLLCNIVLHHHRGHHHSVYSQHPHQLRIMFNHAGMGQRNFVRSLDNAILCGL